MQMPWILQSAVERELEGCPAQAVKASSMHADNTSARYFFMFSSSCDACASCVLFCMLIIIHVECIMSRETE